MNLKEIFDLVTVAGSKKNIESAAARFAQDDIDTGRSSSPKQLVTSNRFLIFFTKLTEVYRKESLYDLRSKEDFTVLGATLSVVGSASKWEQNDPYIASLEAELAIVKDKAKLSEDKDRVHITLAGEEVFIKRAVKIPGGETVKIQL